MKPVIATFLVLGLLATAQASAQPREPQASQPSQRARAAPMAKGIVDPNSVAGWVGQALAFIDKGQLAQLWDGASAVTRTSVKREDFIAGVQAARRPLGAVSGREWSAVRRQRNAESNAIPAGEYASVELITLFAGNQIKTELVTFRHDEDGIWRFTGYVIH